MKSKLFRTLEKSQFNALWLLFVQVSLTPAKFVNLAYSLSYNSFIEACLIVHYLNVGGWGE